MGRFASFTRELRSRALPVAEVCLDAGEPGAPHRARRIDEQRLSVLDDQPGAGGGRKQAHAAADSAMRARRQCECPGGRLSRNFIPKLPRLTVPSAYGYRRNRVRGVGADPADPPCRVACRKGIAREAKWWGGSDGAPRAPPAA